jgi:hypothetical protein
MRRSIDRGETFTPFQNVSNTSGPIYFPKVVSNSLGDLFVAWREPLFPQGEVFFTRSTDSGGNFSSPIDVSNSEGSTAWADLAVDGFDILYLVWDDDGQVVFSQSFDLGETFLDPLPFTEEDGFAGEAAVAARGFGEVALAWHELIDDTFQVMFTRSFDAGTTFTRPRNLSRSPEDATSPRIRIGADSNLYAVYGQRDRGGNLNVAFRRTFRDFQSGDGRERLSETRFLGRGRETDLFLDERGVIYVAWNNAGEILYSFSANGGATFSLPINLSQTPGIPVPNEPGYSSSPSVGVNAQGDVFVVWQEVLPDRNQEIVLSRVVY